MRCRSHAFQRMVSLMKPNGSQLALALALVSAALGAGLLPFVMIGLVGALFLFAAFCLLMIFYLVAPTPDELSLLQRGAGWLLHFVGSLLLIGITGTASVMASAMGSNQSGLGPPTSLHWILLGLSAVLPSVLMALALRNRTAWPWRRCALWGVVVFVVWPTGVLIFWVLTPILPLSA